MASGGCPLFVPLAKSLGVSFSELNFILTQLICLLLAFLYRRFLSPALVGPAVRHGVALTLGLLVGIFFYGLPFMHVLLQATVGYLVTRLAPSRIMHRLVFVAAMSHLIYVQAQRAFFTPRDVLYQLDVTGALMVSTQKVSGLAFSLRDGRSPEEAKMSELRRRMALKKMPSALEYFSYVLYFQAVLVGPMSFFLDYLDFIEGGSNRAADRGRSKTDNNNKPVAQSMSPAGAVAEKVCVAAVWSGFHMLVKPHFPETGNADADLAQRHSFLYRCFFMVLSMLCCRAKYYIAFSLSDAVCNMAGLGFNGVDQHGRPRWDLVSNVNIRGIEFATSMKTYVDNWNIQSSLWLRHVCYDRVPTQRVLLTFLLSAIWHGLYPGYYLSFTLGWPMSLAAKKIRRHVRPHFQQSDGWRKGYDVITWLSTQVALSYMFVPFTLLHLRNSLAFYSLNYWWLHLVLVVILILPARALGGGVDRRSTTSGSAGNGTIRSSSSHNSSQDTTTTQHVENNVKGFHGD